MTDAAEKAVGKRVSARNTRTSAANQERKDTLDTVASLPVASESLEASGGAANVKAMDGSSTESDGSITSDITTTTASIDATSDNSKGRRSARRGAATAAAVPAKLSPTTSNTLPHPLATTTTETVETTAADSQATNDIAIAAAEPATTKDAVAITELAVNSASVASAVSNFDTTRADVIRIVKETAASGDTKLQALYDGKEHDAAEEQARNSDEGDKRRASKRVKPNEEGSATAITPAAIAAAPSDGDIVMASVMEASDLKRSAMDLHGGGAHSDLPMPKAKRVRKTREEKIAILAFVDDGGTHVAAAEKFGVSRTAVTKMVKERDIITNTPSATVSASAVAAVAAAASAAVSVSLIAGGPSLSVEPPVRKPRVHGSILSTSTGEAPLDNPKARRVRKTNEEKLLILEFVERGGSQGAAAEKFGVSRTAVTKMVKEKEAIAAQVMSGKSNHRKVLQYQHKLSIIEDMLYKWQVQVENDAPNLKITGDLLQTKAVEFRDKILTDWKSSLEPEVVQSLSDFKASNGWLHRYLQRRNLRTTPKRAYLDRRSGEDSMPLSPSSSSAAATGFNVHAFLEELAHQLKSVPVNCIWNLDEVALLPSTLAPPSPSADRMTIALMVNAAGERFKPHVVVSESNMAKLSLLQKAHPELVLTGQNQTQNQNPWQDTATLAGYMEALNVAAKSRVETWHVLMDTSVAHSEFAALVDPSGSLERGYRYDNLVLWLLPPHAGSSDQYPIHQGVARVFKAAYRQSLLELALNKWPQHKKSTTAFDLPSLVPMAEQLAMLSRAWDTVPAPLVRHCWVRHGLLAAFQLAQISQDNSRAVEAELFQSLTETVTRLRDLDGGALAIALGLQALAPPAAASSEPLPSILDHVNALIALDDHEATERKPMETLGGGHVITETDANGDLRALV